MVLLINDPTPKSAAHLHTGWTSLNWQVFWGWLNYTTLRMHTINTKTISEWNKASPPFVTCSFCSMLTTAWHWWVTISVVSGKVKSCNISNHPESANFHLNSPWWRTTQIWVRCLHLWKAGRHHNKAWQLLGVPLGAGKGEVAKMIRLS